MCISERKTAHLIRSLCEADIMDDDHMFLAQIEGLVEEQFSALRCPYTDKKAQQKTSAVWFWAVPTKTLKTLSTSYTGLINIMPAWQNNLVSSKGYRLSSFLISGFHATMHWSVHQLQLLSCSDWIEVVNIHFKSLTPDPKSDSILSLNFKHSTLSYLSLLCIDTRAAPMDLQYCWNKQKQNIHFTTADWKGKGFSILILVCVYTACYLCICKTFCKVIFLHHLSSSVKYVL